jgi:predicted Abi (CAAX) family protease
MAANAAIAQYVLARIRRMRSKIMKKNEIRTQRTPLYILMIAMLAMIAGTGVSARPFSEEQLQVSSAAKTGKSQAKTVVKSSGPRAIANSALEGSRYYRPIAEWSGQLIHPNIDRRDPAGGVPFKIEQSPDRSLIGKTVWLRWDTSEPWEQWFNQRRYDVDIDSGRLQKAIKDGLNPPVAIDSWKKVSPLESLSGARPGDMAVMLRNPVWDGSVLKITEEPVQICGKSMALIRFKEDLGGNRRIVVHYDGSSSSFSGPADVIDIPLTYFSRSNTPVARSSTAGIEKSPLNEQGWYVYGRHLEGRFVAEAIEPRAAFMLNSDISIQGRQEVKNYISRDHFDDLRPGLLRRTELLPANAPDWAEGDRGLLIHLFGWREHPDEEGPAKMLGLVTGHLAFGMAQVVRCPLSRELRWDLEYRQVYAHNREGVVSGSMKWHAYSGSLRRGWMYTIPISDTVVRIPELEPYNFNGWEVKPWNGLNRQLEQMQALYRVGAGSGLSTVKQDISCVQDSHAALYSALRTFEETIAKTGKVKEWMSGKGPDAEEVRRYLRLLLMVRDIKKSITTFGIAQSNWREFFNQPLGTRNPNKVVGLINILLSKRSIFPRKGNDNLLRLAADKGYPMWSILTCQIGGEIPKLVPLAPTSPTAR